MERKKILLLFSLLAIQSECQDIPTTPENTVEVTLSLGSITGTVEDMGNGRNYYSFKSIPYAEPPVEELRLLDPVPVEYWNETIDGSVTPPACPQLDLEAIYMGKVKIDGQEDCLYLNIFTPKLSPANLPVMVQIHGGAFLVGEVIDYSPLPLIAEDVILVTFHYRLGTLGFLSTEDSIIPGNFGLKDQTLVLQWVNQHIHHFGGDPKRVTVFGTSAGGASTHFQVLTPHAKGLFSHAILQSGTALSSWALRKDHLETATTVGRILNCPGIGLSPSDFDSTALLVCLQNATFEQLVGITTHFVEWSNEPLVMMPRIDGDYLPDDPALLLKEGNFNKVHLITGINAQDGDITTKDIYSKNNLKNDLVQNFTRIGPIVMNFRDGDENPEFLAWRVFQRYLGGINITENNADDVTQLFTDRLFANSNDLAASLHSQDVNIGIKVYMYEFHHRGQYSLLPAFNTSVSDDWVGHGDEFQYIFDSLSGENPLERPDDRMMRHMMTKLWTNFAATGNPTPVQSMGFRWYPITTKNCLQHLRLQPNAQMHQFEREQTRDFWENLPTVQNKILYPERFEPGYSPVPGKKVSCH